MVTVAAPGSRFVASLERASHPYPSEKEVIKCSLLVKMKRMLRVAPVLLRLSPSRGPQGMQLFRNVLHHPAVRQGSHQVLTVAAAGSRRGVRFAQYRYCCRRRKGLKACSWSGTCARTTRNFRSVRFQMLTPSACLLLSTGSFSHAGASSVARLL